MATLYVYKFNNYYNRRVKKFENLEDYPEPEYIETGTYCNFNPNDGINTTIVLGRPGNNEYPGDCDYFIYSDDNTSITSRWFIIEQTRKMGYQYQVTLHRDVIADNLDKVLSSNCLIERAIVTDSNNLIFNKETASFNQIKKGETLLKDETGCAWLIGFLATNYAGGNLSFTAQVVSDYTGQSVNDLISALSNLSPNTIYRRKTTDNDLVIYATKLQLLQQNDERYRDVKFTWNQNTGYSTGWTYEYIGDYYYVSPHYSWIIPGIKTVPAVKEILDAYFDTGEFTTRIPQLTGTDWPKYVSNSELQVIYGASNKIFTDTDGADAGDYKINVTTGVSTYSYNHDSGNLLTYINSFISTNGLGSPTNSFTMILKNCSTASYTLTPIALGDYTIQIPSEVNRLHLKDAPYDIFCIPYGEIQVRNSKVESFTNVDINKSLAISIAQGIARGLGSNLIDLQLVPYCPMTGFNTGDGYIDINNANTKRFTAIKNLANNNVCYVIWSTAANGSKNIEFTIPVDNLKISNQCDKYRLVSPNYNGQFEFNAAMNNGATVFNIDFSYIPYQPYIHINPVFSRMYGDNYNDARGLICSGDFSVSYLSDAWTNYQVQNKNFQAIFDREIQNMEVSHDWEMKQVKIGAAAGTLSGLVSGVTGGALAGGGVGAIVGGLVGAGASAAGGILDVNMRESLYSEAVDYKKDIFNLQLDNIKALPYSLAKVSSINQNNKVFPFIEFYSCSDEEKTAFANKIAWNSMTVGVVGQILEYIGNSWSYGDIKDKGFIQARLIRMEDANEDFHNVNAIAEELLKGVYLK